MSLTSIEFNYQQALRQASRLDEIANKISRLATGSVEDTLDTLQGAWKGDSASAYVRKGRDFKSKLMSMVKDLKNAASKIRTVAKRIRDAEKAVLDIANKRSY